MKRTSKSMATANKIKKLFVRFIAFTSVIIPSPDAGLQVNSILKEFEIVQRLFIHPCRTASRDGNNLRFEKTTSMKFTTFLTLKMASLLCVSVVSAGALATASLPSGNVVVYPAPVGEQLSTDYTVQVQGRSAPV